jgi:hypothetical protein
MLELMESAYPHLKVPESFLIYSDIFEEAMSRNRLLPLQVLGSGVPVSTGVQAGW